MCIHPKLASILENDWKTVSLCLKLLSIHPIQPYRLKFWRFIILVLVHDHNELDCIPYVVTLAYYCEVSNKSGVFLPILVLDDFHTDVILRKYYISSMFFVSNNIKWNNYLMNKFNLVSGMIFIVCEAEWCVK